MSREIKFRAWTGTKMEYNVMAGWLGAFYVKGMSDKDSACMSEFNTIYYPQTPIMQYTGLKDENGKEIYEGDIVAYRGNIATVVYEEKSFVAFYPISTSAEWDALNEESINKRAVVGNIYENPELIK